MQKKQLFLLLSSSLLAVTVLLSSAVIAFAREGATSSNSGRPIKVNPNELRNLKDKIGSNTGNLKDKLHEREASVGGDRADKIARIKELWSKMDDRLHKAITMEENLITRIESRIQKIKDQGGNTAKAEATLADAKAKLAKVKADLLALEAKGQGLDASTDPKQLVQNLMKDVNAIKRGLLDVHKLLQSMVRDLKGIGLGRIGSSSGELKRSPKPTRSPQATESGER